MPILVKQEHLWLPYHIPDYTCYNACLVLQFYTFMMSSASGEKNMHWQSSSTIKYIHLPEQA